MQIATVGLDIAKRVFQVHGVDERGRPVLKRRLSRDKVLGFFANLPRCLVGLEACGGAHHWARELAKLGHEVRLLAPQYVKPYVKTNKHDATDAEACCEAVQRPGMRFVAPKAEHQQALLMLHRIRDRLVAERTGSISAIRGHAAEFGIVAAQGARGLREILDIIADPGDALLPPLARELLALQVTHLRGLGKGWRSWARGSAAWHGRMPPAGA
jgi:transposase